VTNVVKHFAVGLQTVPSRAFNTGIIRKLSTNTSTHFELASQICPIVSESRHVAVGITKADHKKIVSNGSILAFSMYAGAPSSKISSSLSLNHKVM